MDTGDMGSGEGSPGRREELVEQLCRAHEAQLLHYKFIDPDGYYLQRTETLNARLLDGDRTRKFGRRYGLGREALRHRYQWLDLHATDVVATAAVPTGTG